MIQDGAAITGDIEIGVSIVVIVAYCHSLPVKTFCAHTGLGGDFGKAPVPIVPEKRRMQRLRWFIDVRGGRLNEVDVHKAIVVVIDPAHASAHGLQVILLFRRSGVLLEIESASLRYVSVTDRNGKRLLGLRSLGD